MTRLFDRRYRLQLDTIQVEELNVAFSVVRTLRRRPGRSEVKVWNLSETHRRQVEELRPGQVYVELHAGYADGITRIFRGRLHRAQSVRQGANWVTSVTSRDGRGASSARTSRSFRAGTSIATVARGVVADMGVDEGNVGDDDALSFEGSAGVFAGGATVVGNAAEQLDGILASTGREWSIQDEAVQVLRRGHALTRPAVRLAAETGLRDDPGPTRDERGRLHCRVDLIPDITPGALVSVESALHRGTFRVEQVTYKGELDGADWHIDLVCAEPGASSRAA